MPHTTPTGYEEKFEHFIKLCAKAKADGVSEVIVAVPWVIGDTYDEIVESIGRLADAGLALRCLGRASNPLKRT
ncbi:MAG: hypothetical protein ACLQVY_00885 [Limisphaerales bacterium]